MPVAEPGEGLILDQTEAPKKLFFETAPAPPPPPAYLRVRMTALDTPLKTVSVSGVSSFRFV